MVGETCHTMFNKNIIILFSLLIVVSTSCSREMKFDRDKWDYGDGLIFPNRDKMLNDLLQNHKLKGLKYQQVISLLHRPQRADSTMMYYEIVSQLDLGSKKPNKNLILYLNKDSVVTDIKVVESGNKK
ncbi:hypothetical protein M2273_003676 [Mucilaginibacter lappiensis]